MQQRDLTATSFFASRLTLAVIVAMGIFFVFQPSWLGWDTFVRWLDDPAPAAGGQGGGFAGPHGHGALRLVSFGVGCLFFLAAAISFEKDQIRLRIAEIMEALHQLLYGRDYARDREAIEILLRTFDSTDPAARRIAHENLIRLTGQHFADDAAVWRSWWEANRRTWSRAKGSGGAAGGAAPDGPAKP